MVYLNRIYTKSGDLGETSLGDGSRVSKTSQRIIAYGGTDELNAVIGIVISSAVPDAVANTLCNIQNDLFDVGADLCVPEAQTSTERRPLRVTDEQVTKIEKTIDQFNERLQPLESFILPGGSPPAAHLHHARTVCRRVELEVLKLAEVESINPQIVIYLNRLSDLLFVLARICNNNGQDDILWIPGQNRNSENEDLQSS